MTQNAELLSPPSTAPAFGGLKTPKATVVLRCCVAVLAVAGCLGIYWDAEALVGLWTYNPLRSIGMLIPPVSILLTLRVWRQMGWEMRGNWWGLLLVGMSFLISVVRQNSIHFAVVAGAMVALVPVSLAVYAYGSGVVLLFAGTRVWRKAWFPLGLLLFCNPVPGLANKLVDLPLQFASAHVARSFATLIGFAPTSDQLRLMFSPDFGMFIAPGCDGIRGAVTLGYVALVLGYLNHVPWRRWVAYVTGAVLLGYVFNFIRLCVLVIYYRIALGHPTLQGFAEQADYGIGSSLFLVAILLFLWLIRKEQSNSGVVKTAPAREKQSRLRIRSLSIKCLAFAFTLLLALSLPSSAVRPKSPVSAATLAMRMPRQIGSFTLTRTWSEQIGGKIVMQDAAYSAPGSDEIMLGVWVASTFHDPNDCWIARGLQADSLTAKPFVDVRGRSLQFHSGSYSDGVTDSVLVSGICTPSTCLLPEPDASSGVFGFIRRKPELFGFEESGTHPIPFMIRIDRPRSNAPKDVDYALLSEEAEKFVAGFDPMSFSKAFQ